MKVVSHFLLSLYHFELSRCTNETTKVIPTTKVIHSAALAKAIEPRVCNSYLRIVPMGIKIGHSIETHTAAGQAIDFEEYMIKPNRFFFAQTRTVVCVTESSVFLGLRY